MYFNTIIHLIFRDDRGYDRRDRGGYDRRDDRRTKSPGKHISVKNINNASKNYCT